MSEAIKLHKDQVFALNEKHGWFTYGDAQSDVSRAFASDAIAEYERVRNEATAVCVETGLTPSQLVERVKEMEEACKHCEDLLMRHEINCINGEEIADTALAMLRAALSKARPNTADGEAAQQAPAAGAVAGTTSVHIAAMERAWLWMENQADSQSKGGHATFDLMMLREERDALRAAIDMEVAATCPHCNGAGEVFGHAENCTDDLCALNGDEHSCAGQVEPCQCAAVPTPAAAKEPSP